MLFLSDAVCSLIFSFDGTFREHFDAHVKPALVAAAQHDAFVRQCGESVMWNNHWRNVHTIYTNDPPGGVRQILSYMNLRNCRVVESCACVFFDNETQIYLTMLRNRQGQKRWFVGDDVRYRSMISRRCKNYGVGPC